MATEPTPQFITAIAAAVEYWRRRTEELDDAAIARLDEERQNLYRAVEFGLKRPETWEAAAEVALQTFDLVERRGYWQEWIPMLEAAVNRCTNKHLHLNFKLLVRLGQLQRLNQQLSEALATHKKAELITQELKDERAIAEVHHSLLEDYLNTHEYEEAEKYGLATLAYFDKLNIAPKWTADALKMLGITSRERGDLTTAEKRLSRAVAIWRTLSQPSGLARALNDLANTRVSAGKFDQALQDFKEAADLLEPTNNELDKAMIQISIGTLYFNKEQWADAEAAFRQANSPYLRKSGYIYRQALVANNMGNVLLRQKRLLEAESYLRHALTLWQSVNDQIALGNTLGTLGETLVTQGNEADAITYYRDAIMLLAKHPDSAWARKLLQKFQEQMRIIGEGSQA